MRLANIHQPVILIGMHRSGTTLVAEALNRSGVCMGVFREHNGEALHFLSLNQQLLAAAGGDWLNPVVPPGTATVPFTPNQLYAEHIKSPSANALRLRLCYALPWGWKDPRNTFTLPYWLTQFPKAKVLHIIRNGMDVALSLQARNKQKGEVFDPRVDDLRFNFQVWERYVAQGLGYAERLKHNYHLIQYEAIVNKNEEAASGVKRFLGRDIYRHLQIKPRLEPQYPEVLRKVAAESTLFKKLGYRC